MKILQVIPRLSGGGAERFTIDLSNQLTDYKVSLINFYPLEEKRDLGSVLKKKINRYCLDKRRGFDYRFLKKLYKKINRIQPDIIHSHLHSINYLIPLYPFLKTPLLFTVHSDAFRDCPNPLVRNIRRMFFKQRSIIPVTISKESQQSFKKAYNGVESKLIYNGRAFPKRSSQYKSVEKDVEAFKNNKETRVFVHIGRITSSKNQLMLVRAFNKLIYKYHTNAVLLLIGGSNQTSESRKIQQQLKQQEKNNKHIHLLGERSNATDYLHAANFFCLSSIYEGMPITLIEAFATGCIPVCTPVGGIPEMMEDLDESLISNNVNGDDYVRVLKKATDIDTNSKRKLKQKSKKIFDKKYSMKHCSAKYLKLYQNLVNRCEA